MNDKNEKLRSSLLKVERALYDVLDLVDEYDGNGIDSDSIETATVLIESIPNVMGVKRQEFIKRQIEGKSSVGHL